MSAAAGMMAPSELDARVAGSRTVARFLSTQAARHRRLGRLILLGLLWAIAIASIEASNIPNISSTFGEAVRVVVVLLTNFSVEGVIFAIAIHWSTAKSMSWPRLALAVVAAAVVGSIVVEFGPISHLWIEDDAIPTNATIVGRIPAIAPFVWNTWLGIVYGAFAATIYGLRRRIDLTSRALADANLARERNEAAIAEARVQSMVERIEPTFLVDVMDAARRFYAVDVPRAEAIINECVEFLRTAMPQIRSGRSTLQAELDVAESFLTLRALTMDGCPPWTIDRSDDQEVTRVASRLAMPPLVLLPVLERLMTRTSECPTPMPTLRIALVRRAADLLLTIDSPSRDAEVVEGERLAAITARLALACDGSIALERRDDGSFSYAVAMPDAALAPSHLIPPVFHQVDRPVSQTEVFP